MVGGGGRGKSEMTCVLCVILGLELELGEEQVGPKPVMELAGKEEEDRG